MQGQMNTSKHRGNSQNNQKIRNEKTANMHEE